MNRLFVFFRLESDLFVIRMTLSCIEAKTDGKYIYFILSTDCPEGKYNDQKGFNCTGTNANIILSFQWHLFNYT